MNFLCGFEVTSRGTFSEELKKLLDDYALYIFRVEKFFPDLTGWVLKTVTDTFNLITVEVKKKMRIKDISQAKLYADILNAKYCLLVVTKPISEEIRRFILERNLLFRYGYDLPLIIAVFDEKTKQVQIDVDTYLGLAETLEFFKEWMPYLVEE